MLNDEYRKDGTTRPAGSRLPFSIHHSAFCISGLLLLGRGRGGAARGALGGGSALGGGGTLGGGGARGGGGALAGSRGGSRRAGGRGRGGALGGRLLLRLAGDGG